MNKPTNRNHNTWAITNRLFVTICDLEPSSQGWPQFKFKSTISEISTNINSLRKKETGRTTKHEELLFIMCQKAPQAK